MCSCRLSHIQALKFRFFSGRPRVIRVKDQELRISICIRPSRKCFPLLNQQRQEGFRFAIGTLAFSARKRFLVCSAFGRSPFFDRLHSNQPQRAPASGRCSAQKKYVFSHSLPVFERVSRLPHILALIRFTFTNRNLIRRGPHSPVVMVLDFPPASA